MASLEYVKMTPQIWAEGSSTQRHWERDWGGWALKPGCSLGGRAFNVRLHFPPQKFGMWRRDTLTPSKSYSLTQKSLAPPESEINSQLCQRSWRCLENRAKVSALGTSPPAVSWAVTPECALGCQASFHSERRAAQHKLQMPYKLCAPFSHWATAGTQRDLKAPRQ